MKRYEWDAEFIRIIIEQTSISQDLAIGLADSADDSFNDNETPSDAVDIELSYWGD